MKYLKALTTIVISFMAIELYGVMHYQLEQGVDFGSHSMNNVVALSDGRYASFGAHSVDVCTIESDSMAFGQRLYSSQYYLDAKALGPDTLLALTWQNRLDIYSYHPAAGLSLVQSYDLTSDDNSALSAHTSLLYEDYCVIGNYVTSTNPETSYCQSIYALNGAGTPTLTDRDYLSNSNRIVSISKLGQNYYYFCKNRNIYTSPILTNQPEPITCAGLAGHLIYNSKVLQGSIYTISKDNDSQFWLSKLDTSEPGNINVAWTISLGSINSAKITDIMGAYVYVMIQPDYGSSIINRYLFSDHLAWQYMNSNSFVYDGYQLFPRQNGLMLVGYSHAWLLNDSLAITAGLFGGSNYWWCDEVFLNRYLLLYGENNGESSIFDLVNECWLNFRTINVFNTHALRYGEDHLVFMGGQIQLVALGDDGTIDTKVFPNQSNYMYGSYFEGKLILSKYMNSIGQIHLYQINGTDWELLGTFSGDQITDAMQFYDETHFAAICHTAAQGFMLKLYRIEGDYAISEIASYPITGTAMYLNNHVLIVDGTSSVIVDLSQPDSPALLEAHPLLNGIRMSFNGLHHYMSGEGEYASIYDDAFQFVGNMENINPFFIGGNRVMFPGPSCAVICTLEGIAANPPEEDMGIPSPEVCLRSFPNPFQTSTTIEYDLAKPGSFGIKIYNIKGQLVKTIADGQGKAGSFTVNWDGKDEQGRAVASGVYICMLEASGRKAAQKLMILR